MSNTIQIKHGNSIPNLNNLENFELGYCTSDGLLYINNGVTIRPIIPSIQFPISIENGGTGATTAEGARSNLGLGSVVIEDVIPISKGGTNATTVDGARASLGLGNVATENIVPISKGGTGANNANTALANLNGVPISGATLTGQLCRNIPGYMWIKGRETAFIRSLTCSTDSFYPVYSAKTVSGSWDVGTLANNLYLSYATDTDYNANRNNTMKIYFDTEGHFSGKAENVYGTIGISNGGTGATNAADARTNLGIKSAATRNLTYGTSDPSGGSNGDIYIKY